MGSEKSFTWDYVIYFFNRDKHSSLLGMFVNYDREKFYIIEPWG
jgi:hypothetical protein